jgi:hypothetical protein
LSKLAAPIANGKTQKPAQVEKSVLVVYAPVLLVIVLESSVALMAAAAHAELVALQKLVMQAASASAQVRRHIARALAQHNAIQL